MNKDCELPRLSFCYCGCELKSFKKKLDVIHMELMERKALKLDSN